MNNKIKMSHERIGFTLIELIMVVIIISIIVAIAGPIYQNMIWKARFTEVFTVVGAIANAERVYYMENGRYTFPSSIAQGEGGSGIDTGSTEIQHALGVDIDKGSRFVYLIEPVPGAGSLAIFFLEPGYDWAWYYVYAPPGSTQWRRYSTYPAGGPAQEFFKPPS